MSHVLKAKGVVLDMSKTENVRRLKRIIESKYGTWLPENKAVNMYIGPVEARVGFHLRGWRYPCAVTAKGELKYDPWGTEENLQKNLQKVCQDYASQSIQDTAISNGWAVEDTTVNRDGSIQITLTR